MNFVEDASLGLLAAHLCGSRSGTSTCTARLERFTARSGKRAKAAARQLEAKILQDLDASPDSPELTESALGHMKEARSRHLLSTLVAALSATRPELNFEDVSPASFARVPLMAAAQAVNAVLVVPTPDFLASLWSTIDHAIDLKHCDVFSFQGDLEEDAGAGPALWSFNYFFVNLKAKEIVFFSCTSVPSASLAGLPERDAVGALGQGLGAPAPPAVGKGGSLTALLSASQDYEDARWDMEEEDEEE